MIVGIVGSRDYPLPERVFAFVRGVAKKHPDATIVSGGARGVDKAAENAARLNGLSIISYRPYKYEAMGHGKTEWSVETVTAPDEHQENRRRINPPYYTSFPKAAFARNHWIVNDSDVVVAFWDGTSKGTAHSIRAAQTAGKRVFVYGPAGDLNSEWAVQLALKD